MNFITKRALALGAIFPLGSLAAYGNTNQFWTFLSRPDLTPPKFDFTTLNTELMAPGYTLVTPYTPPPGSNLAAGSTISVSDLTPAEIAQIIAVEKEVIQNGPYVYDQSGNLVYSGYGSTGGEYEHDLKITEYQGQPHMSYFSGNDQTGGNRGHGIIMDSQYHTVQTISSGFGRAPNDVHEFTVINGGSTAITTVFQPAQYDLASYGLVQPADQPWGWVVEGIFQEIDIANGKVLFEWRSLDHTTPAQSYNDRSSAGAGNGSSVSTIWDYFHLNSVEKDDSGNYLISSRYLCALFYIDGNDGSIIWELNGKKNQFTFEGFDNNTFPFAFQHHSRFHSQNETTAIISIFDNGSDGEINVSTKSAGMVMAVDTSTMTCTLLRQYSINNDAGAGVLSTSQGSTQLLDNTNVFLGWGSEPYISEFTVDGTLVMQGQFGAENVSMSYRAFKADWVGNPDSTPALWSESTSPSSPTTFYTSWNGATEIASWKFFGGATERACETELGTVVKTGFETNYTASKFYAYGYSEALDAGGRVIGTSPVRQTYVPGQNLTVPPAQNGTTSNTTSSNTTTATYAAAWRA